MPKVNPYRRHYEAMKLVPYVHRVHDRESLSVPVDAPTTPPTADMIAEALYRFDGSVRPTADYLQLSEKQLRRIIDNTPSLQQSRKLVRAGCTAHTQRELIFLGDAIIRSVHDRRRLRNATDEHDYTLHEIDTMLKGIDCHSYAINDM